jgi:glycosyltransferase involved in cell wall biosynthesis
MKKEPLLSVIIPAHNEERYISRPLSSLKKQTYGNFEIIVIEDTCDDKTGIIARGYGAKVIQVKTKNLPKNRNIGVKKARGEIIVFIDADVRISRDYLKKIVDSVDKGYISGRPNYYFDSNNVLIKNHLFFNNLLKMRYYPHTCFVLKKCFHKIGGYDESMNNWEDLDFSERINKIGRSCCIDAKAYNCERRFIKKGIIKEMLYEFTSPLLFFISYRLMKIKKTTNHGIIR